MAWWVISDEQLRAALQQARDGVDVGLIEAELYANSEIEHVEPEE